MNAKNLDHNIADLITRTSKLLTTFLIVTMQYFIPPLGVLMLTYAEIGRVSDGISFFDPGRASLLATVTLMVYIALQTVRAHLIHAEYGSMESPKYSLRETFREIKYFLGIGGKFFKWGTPWQQQNKSSLELLQETNRTIGIVIILLGTLGSMHNQIASIEGVWYVGVAKIFTESSLAQFITYIGGFILTAALLRGIEWVIPYSYNIFLTNIESVENAPESEGNDEQDPKGIMQQKTPYSPPLGHNEPSYNINGYHSEPSGQPTRHES